MVSNGFGKLDEIQSQVMNMSASLDERGGSPDRVVALDGLRAFAIAPVIFCHFVHPQETQHILQFFSHLGWLGVDLFFVLSGFLITGILLRTKDSSSYYKSFLLRRALRILPLYYACLTIFHLLHFFIQIKNHGIRLWTGADPPGLHSMWEI